jgi:hypothetical protein
MESTPDTLADRLAATLIAREPGWRLPRRGTLARKHHAELDELDTALGELVQRALVRRLPDGQLYRASQDAAWIPVEGVSGLATRLDPMGNAIDCASRQVSQDSAPPEVALLLGLAPDAVVSSVRTVWSAADVPAASAVAYRADGDSAGDNSGFAERLTVVSARVEVGQAEADTVSALGLAPDALVVKVTAAFSDGDSIAGIAIVALRAELFRVAVET